MFSLVAVGGVSCLDPLKSMDRADPPGSGITSPKKKRGFTEYTKEELIQKIRFLESRAKTITWLLNPKSVDLTKHEQWGTKFIGVVPANYDAQKLTACHHIKSQVLKLFEFLGSKSNLQISKDDRAKWKLASVNINEKKEPFDFNLFTEGLEDAFRNLKKGIQTFFPENWKKKISDLKDFQSIFEELAQKTVLSPETVKDLGEHQERLKVFQALLEGSIENSEAFVLSLFKDTVAKGGNPENKFWKFLWKEFEKIEKNQGVDLAIKKKGKCAENFAQWVVNHPSMEEHFNKPAILKLFFLNKSDEEITNLSFSLPLISFSSAKKEETNIPHVTINFRLALDLLSKGPITSNQSFFSSPSWWDQSRETMPWGDPKMSQKLIFSSSKLKSLCPVEEKDFYPHISTAVMQGQEQDWSKHDKTQGAMPLKLQLSFMYGGGGEFPWVYIFDPTLGEGIDHCLFAPGKARELEFEKLDGFFKKAEVLRRAEDFAGLPFHGELTKEELWEKKKEFEVLFRPFKDIGALFVKANGVTDKAAKFLEALRNPT